MEEIGDFLKVFLGSEIVLDVLPRFVSLSTFLSYHCPCPHASATEKSRLPQSNIFSLQRQGYT